MLVVDFLREICDVELYGSGIGDIGLSGVIMDEDQLVNYRRLITIYNRVCSEIYSRYPIEVGEVEIQQAPLPISVLKPDGFDRVLAVVDGYSRSRGVKAHGDNTKFGVAIEGSSLVVDKLLFGVYFNYDYLFPLKVFYAKKHTKVTPEGGETTAQVVIPEQVHRTLSFGIAYYATLTPDVGGSDGGQNAYGRLYFKGLNNLNKDLGIPTYGANFDLLYKRGFER